jgi:3-phenylpropionate/trans-cinnamate dioxygenase ferredoxin component
MSWTRAIVESELPRGSARPVSVDGERLVICRLEDGEVYAVEDSCSHDDGPLGQGTLAQGQIECPRHGARFDVRTGAATRMPAASPIETFPARIDAGWVEIDLEAR